MYWKYYTSFPGRGENKRFLNTGENRDFGGLLNIRNLWPPHCEKTSGGSKKKFSLGCWALEIACASLYNDSSTMHMEWNYADTSFQGTHRSWILLLVAAIMTDCSKICFPWSCVLLHEPLNLTRWPWYGYFRWYGVLRC